MYERVFSIFLIGTFSAILTAADSLPDFKNPSYEPLVRIPSCVSINYMLVEPHLDFANLPIDAKSLSILSKTLDGTSLVNGKELLPRLFFFLSLIRDIAFLANPKDPKDILRWNLEGLLASLKGVPPDFKTLLGSAHQILQYRDLADQFFILRDRAVLFASLESLGTALRDTGLTDTEAAMIGNFLSAIFLRANQRSEIKDGELDPDFAFRYTMRRVDKHQENLGVCVTKTRCFTNGAEAMHLSDPRYAVVDKFTIAGNSLVPTVAERKFYSNRGVSVILLPKDKFPKDLDPIALATWLGVFVHEKAHYITQNLFQQWLAANWFLMEKGQAASPLFLQFVRFQRGPIKVEVHNALYRAVHETISYSSEISTVHFLLENHSLPFQREQLVEKIKKDWFNQVVNQGGGPVLELMGINPETLSARPETISKFAQLIILDFVATIDKATTVGFAE